MTNDTEHFFMCLLLTYITSVVIFLLKFFAHFYLVIYLLLLNYEISLSYLKKKYHTSFIIYMYCEKFSPSLWLMFPFS